MRSLGQIFVAFLVLTIGPALWLGLPSWMPAPLFPVLIALYLGTITKERAPIAVATAIAVGYLADLYFGTPKGAWATVCGVIAAFGCFFAKSLLARGKGYEATVGFFAAFAAGLTMVLLRSLSGVDISLLGEVGRIALDALMTALFAPLVFALCRRCDSGRDRSAQGGSLFAGSLH